MRDYIGRAIILPQVDSPAPRGSTTSANYAVDPALLLNVLLNGGARLSKIAQLA
jgi:hypothetical protein